LDGYAALREDRRETKQAVAQLCATAWETRPRSSAAGWNGFAYYGRMVNFWWTLTEALIQKLSIAVGP
jgi:hypothetical protein